MIYIFEKTDEATTRAMKGTFDHKYGQVARNAENYTTYKVGGYEPAMHGLKAITINMKSKKIFSNADVRYCI